MRILVTNDDGYLAVGIGVLASAARGLGEVTVVAPDREQSATSHSLTLRYPLRVREAAANIKVVDGTPTDCVVLALGAVLGEKPDFVLSGINHGPNLGDDVLYSGTVAAAMEATILGVPAIAVSYAGADAENLPEWEHVIHGLLEQLVTRSDLPSETLFNVNLPALTPGQVRGVKITTLGRRAFVGSLARRLDPAGREYFWIGAGESMWREGKDTDFQAVQSGYISVTPLHLDLTNYALLQSIREWDLKL